jgi:hypothetical protein
MMAHQLFVCKSRPLIKAAPGCKLRVVGDYLACSPSYLQKKKASLFYIGEKRWHPILRKQASHAQQPGPRCLPHDEDWSTDGWMRPGSVSAAPWRRLGRVDRRGGRTRRKGKSACGFAESQHPRAWVGLFG